MAVAGVALQQAIDFRADGSILGDQRKVLGSDHTTEMSST
jgi:hypothetical protein